MEISRTPTPHSLGGRRSNRSRDSQDAIQESPQTLLSPGSSKQDFSKQESSKQESLKQDSLKQDSPSRRVLFSYQHVFFICRKSAISLSSLVYKKNSREPVAESVAKPNAQPKSIMSLKLDRLKDKWYDFKTRTSPAIFRCAGYIFLILVLIVVASVIVGWYGLSEDTLSHQAVTAESSATAPMDPEYHESFSPTQTALDGQPYIVAHRDMLQASPATATDPSTNKIVPTTPSEEIENITVVHTVIVTITSVITNTALKTLTTTVILSTCTSCMTTPTVGTSTDTKDSQTSTAEGVMTGIMYCSFTGRRNIYTLCPLVHTDSPAMLTGTPDMVSSAAPRMKNSFSAVRIAVLSLWNSIPSLGSVIKPGDPGAYDCNCTGMKKKLDSAMDLIRMQQQLLDSQQSIINEHRKSLFLALETLANITAARIGEKRARGAPLDLKI
ncbi:hypothetical protein E0Z10_g10467 [Xylaria hypoxylon]|uniref:Uncharacterized protein n=1 Tax=Xylaria hypoxylon TaxID=37992 RepID=A0A4Z0Y602_9PEZI|nr:hypothetical protein E0Z10_g10467 [Xylaria hypoxylon]